MFLTQKGNENEEISRSLETEQIHTKVQHNQLYNQKGKSLIPVLSLIRVYYTCLVLSKCKGTRLPSK